MTLQAKGDSVLSLFLTVVSNLMAILTIPVMLGIYMSSEGNVLDPVLLALRLVYTVLVPVVAGIVARHIIPGSVSFSKNYKVEFGLWSTFNLAVLVWMALSNARETLFQQQISQIIYVIAISIVMHALYLLLNTLVVSKYVLNVPLKQAISVVIMSSQKSSPVGLAVISNLSAAPSDKGMFAIPCIIGQLTQIFIGTYYAPKVKKWVEDEEARAAVSKASVETNSLPPPPLKGGREEGQSQCTAVLGDETKQGGGRDVDGDVELAGQGTTEKYLAVLVHEPSCAAVS